MKTPKTKRHLGEYRRKRDFRTTSEPRPLAGTASGRLYVIQRHAARRLHYDFRLEHRGVLLSWAVPKGPSLDPADKRLAVQVEDHPVAYGSFEGEIPAGQYGAGSVLLWDRGRWTPHGDVDAGLKKGHLEFELDGEKLQGRFDLVRMHPRDAGKSAKPTWLLIKADDEFADRSRAVAEAKRESVAKRKSVAKQASVRRRPPRAQVGALPKVGFELATLVSDAPDGDEWLHETKWDGVRLFAVLDRGHGRLVTRGGKDWTARLPGIAAAIERLPVRQAVLDGEAVVLDAEGISRFQALQQTLKQPDHPPVLMAFDLLFRDGKDLREFPLEQRKLALQKLLEHGHTHNGSTARARARGTVRYCEHEIGDGPKRLARACRLGLEGIVSKRRDAPYHAARDRSWCKSKCHRRQEFVIAGYTEPAGARSGFGALELAVHGDDGKLVPTGRVGAGFDEATLAELKSRLARLEKRNGPFVDANVRSRGVHWVRPELVAEVEFTEWTADGRLRHPVFVGLREDKAAREVVREIERAPTVRAPAVAASATILGVEISHGERIVIPQSKVTKLALARYFAEVGERMAPYVYGRPLMLLRCTAGGVGRCFFQKHLDETIPGVDGVAIPQKDGATPSHPVVRSTKGLVALAQRSVVELHVWGSTAEDFERPDRVVFDLDPAQDVEWQRIVEAAREMRARLRDAGLESFVQTTGGKGLHVVVPIVRQHAWPQVHDFAEAFARAMAEESPDEYVAQATKSARAGRIFIDYLRNGRGATAIAPYSPRARAGAPVATPVSWNELDEIGPDSFGVATIARRLASLRRDPWREFSATRQQLRVAAVRAPSDCAARARRACRPAL